MSRRKLPADKQKQKAIPAFPGGDGKVIHKWLLSAKIIAPPSFQPPDEAGCDQLASKVASLHHDQGRSVWELWDRRRSSPEAFHVYTITAETIMALPLPHGPSKDVKPPLPSHRASHKKWHDYVEELAETFMVAMRSANEEPPGVTPTGPLGKFLAGAIRYISDEITTPGATTQYLREKGYKKAVG